MNSDRYRKIRQLFQEVCDLDEPQREKRLAETCAGDAELRQCVESLLAADRSQENLSAEVQPEAGRERIQHGRLKTTHWGAATGDGARYLPGTKVAGRYRIVSLLGVGGMGEVYRADDMKLGHPVALKFLPGQMSENGSRLQCLLTEVRLARQVSHPNVCRVFDIGEADGIHFLSMEYVDGEDLGLLLTRIGCLPRAKGMEIAKQLCRGLNAAHQQGILHRDLKPSNVMIDGRGQARIMDFGLARMSSDPGSSRQFAGTPAYMAPEQLTRGETTVLSDIYSLGLVLYELFTGQAVHRISTVEDLSKANTTAPPPPSHFAEDIDPAIDQVVLACLETDPGLRPPSADAVARALPGGNLMEAALAAGEMPLTEWVAAAGDQQRMSPAVTALILTGLWVGLCVLGFLSRRIQNDLHIQLNALIRTGDAERISRSLGIHSDRVDSTWGLRWNPDYFEYFRADEKARLEWRQLTGRSPRPTAFWYRQSPDNLVPWQGRGPYSSMFVTPDDPPLAEPGACSLVLDSDGKLLNWQAIPPLTDNVQRSDDAESWRRLLFEAAGFDSSQFGSLFVRDLAQEGSRSPPLFADDWEVWRSKTTSTTVEAAAVRGQPVYFRVAPASTSARPPTTAVRPLILVITALTLFGTAISLAYRNWKSRTADRRGTMRLFWFVLATSLVFWLCQAHHVAGPGEATMLLETLARGILRGALICAAYVGLEPYVRKTWPRVLVGWNRLLSRGFFDRHVARDMLIGICGGLVAQLIASVGIMLGFDRYFSLTADPILRVGEGPFPLEPLSGILVAVGQVSRELFVGLVGGFFACLVFVFVLYLVLRNRLLAALAVVLFFSFPSIVSGDFAAAVVVAMWVSLGLALLFRFGVLAVVTAWTAWQILSWPVGFSFSTPYVDIGALGFASVFCLAIAAGCLASWPRRANFYTLQPSRPAT